MGGWNDTPSLGGGWNEPTSTGGGWNSSGKGGGGLLSGFLSGPAGGLPSITGGDARSDAVSQAINRGTFSYSAPFTLGGSGAGVNTGGQGLMQIALVGAIILGGLFLWRKT
jgi:hypothetical protein